MSAQIGNQLWKLRATHGRKPIFENPDELWMKACEYFDWIEKNPILETKAFHFQGEVVKDTVPRIRAMTIQGLCFFLNISDDAWANYCKRDDFIGICNDIKRVIFAQKFEGAASDQLNASIIARELGLADKKESTIDAKVQVDLMSELIDEISE